MLTVFCRVWKSDVCKTLSNISPHVAVVHQNEEICHHQQYSEAQKRRQTLILLITDWLMWRYWRYLIRLLKLCLPIIQNSHISASTSCFQESRPVLHSSHSCTVRLKWKGSKDRNRKPHLKIESVDVIAERFRSLSVENINPGMSETDILHLRFWGCLFQAGCDAARWSRSSMHLIPVTSSHPLREPDKGLLIAMMGTWSPLFICISSTTF